MNDRLTGLQVKRLSVCQFDRLTGSQLGHRFKGWLVDILGVWQLDSMIIWQFERMPVGKFDRKIKKFLLNETQNGLDRKRIVNGWQKDGKRIAEEQSWPPAFCFPFVIRLLKSTVLLRSNPPAICSGFQLRLTGWQPHQMLRKEYWSATSPPFVKL